MAKEEEKLSAAQRSKIRRLSQPKELAVDEEGGELNIVPFLDIIMNVLMFVLATVLAPVARVVFVKPPSLPTVSASSRKPMSASQFGFGVNLRKTLPT